MSPLCSEKEHAKILQDANNFLSSRGGYVLQFFLILRSWLTDNYISSWWIKYIYLGNRASLLINSNYYGLDYGLCWPNTSQVARAALLTHILTRWRDMLEDESLEPLKLRGFIPLCMDQYRNMLGTTRVPRLTPLCDEIVHFRSDQGSRHVAVLIDGCFYRLGLYIQEKKGKGIKSTEQLGNEIQAMIDDSKKAPARAKVATLTAWTRDDWAIARVQHATKRVLDMIETSVFVLCLPSLKTPGSISTRGEYLLTAGTGTEMWLDKSLNLCVFEDGKVGFNAEHSNFDGTVLGHMWEWMLTEERRIGYSDSTKTENPVQQAVSSVSTIEVVHRYDFEETSELLDSIAKAKASLVGFSDDLDLHQFLYDRYGQGVIKAVGKVSPDGFVQLAIQLAWRRMYGNVVPVYEPCMMRLFLKGRTDTIRSVTSNSAEFTKQFDNKEISVEKKQELLREAVYRHSQTTRNNMADGGIDRHLFGLAVIATGIHEKFGWMTEELRFLKEALSRPWTISSSQVPHTQLNAEDLDADINAPGVGGFAAVDRSGYGIGYCFAGQNRIMITVTSFKSSDRTDSKRFAESLTKAIDDMISLCRK
eukprot:CFRG5437T1